MASENRSAIRAGTFIVIGVILIISITVAIKGFGQIFMPNQHREVVFLLTDNVGGLNVGDDVRLGGYKVGVVNDIDVIGLDTAEKEQPRIVVKFAIPKRYVLRKDPHIGIEGTLTGTSWLNIDSLGGGEALASDAPLTGTPSAMGAIFASLSGVATEFKTTTIPKLNNTLDTFKQTATSATGAMESVKDLFGGESKTDFKGTLANLNASTGKLKEKLPAILDKVDGALVKLDGTIDSTKATIDDIRVSAANAKDITASAKAVISGNKGKLDNMIASLKATGDNLKNATAELRRSPWRLIYKPAPGDEQNLQLYDSARQFADGANKLNDAALALRDAMQNPNLDKAEMQKLVEKLDESFGNFNDVEQKLWKSVKE